MRHERVRYRDRTFVTRVLAPSLSVLGWGPGLLFIAWGILGGGSGGGAAGPFVIGLGAVWTLAGLALIVPAFWPPLVLTTGTLRLARVFRRAESIPPEPGHRDRPGLQAPTR
jgi:hypothetical protein